MATLKAKKKKEINAKALGNKPRTSDSLTDKETEKLCASRCLGHVHGLFEFKKLDLVYD